MEIEKILPWLYYNANDKEDYFEVVRDTTNTIKDISDEIASYEKYYQIEHNQYIPKDLGNGKIRHKYSFLIKKEHLKFTNFAEIRNEIYTLYANNKLDKDIILNALLFRFSYDESLSFFTTDVLKRFHNQEDYRLLYILIDTFLDPSKININIRKIQPEKSRTKNDQLRFDVRYTLYNLVSINSDQMKLIKQSEQYSKRDVKHNFIAKYDLLNTILDTDIDEAKIEKLRYEYGYQTANSDDLRRSYKVKQLASQVLEHKCFCCDGEYNLSDRTFVNRSEQLYLEIHHIIPFASNKQYADQLPNLVKLCPSCHKSLSKGYALESTQKENISKIIANAINFEDYFLNIYSASTKEEIVNKIYELLT